MRIAIAHHTSFTFTPPARALVQNLRLSPRSFDSQYVLRWRLEIDVDGALSRGEDSLGNLVSTFSHPAAVERFTISAIGEVETSDAVGVVRGEVEPLPAAMFLRASPLAQANRALREFATEAVGGAVDRVERLHLLMAAVHGAMTYDPGPSEAHGEAAEAFALRRGGAASSPMSSSPVRGFSRFPPVSSAAILPRARPRHRACSPGPKWRRPISAGSPSIRSTTNAPTSATCASQSASTGRARRRSAPLIRQGAGRRSIPNSKSSRRLASPRTEPACRLTLA
jgi:hypothetical protein